MPVRERIVDVSGRPAIRDCLRTTAARSGCAGTVTRPTRPLVEESARLTLTDLPRSASKGRELQALWDEQAVLAPSEADDTLRRLESELVRIAPELERLLARQREIALEFRGLARSPE